MRMNKDGVKFIASLEGCELTAYKDIAGVWTIGYGHTGKDVKQGMKITQMRADELLEKDVYEFEMSVTDMVHVPLTQSQFNALVSFAYNVGASALRNSTLLKKVNKKDYKGASEEFMRWVYVTVDGKKVVAKGLKNRREKEKALFDKKLQLVEAYKKIEVRGGMTLTHYAKRFGVSVDELAKINKIENPDRIYVGQILKVPVK